MLVQGEYFYLMPIVLAVFFFIAPLMGISLYELSRREERKEAISLCFTSDAWQRNSFNLTMMGLTLMVISLFWMMIAVLIFALFYNHTLQSDGNFFWTLFFSGDNILFIIVGSIAGLFIALFTFSITAISVPMLMDKDISFTTAIQVSQQAVWQNKKVMVVWAYLIAMLIAVSFLSLYIGLIIAIPIIGHASWHAYKSLVSYE